MSSPSRDVPSPGGPKVLVNGRTFLAILQVAILLVLMSLWGLGIGLVLHRRWAYRT